MDAKAFGRVAVRLSGRLRVDAQRRPRVGVAEADLGRLDVDALGDQGRGRRAPQIVELEARRVAGSQKRWRQWL